MIQDLLVNDTSYPGVAVDNEETRDDKADGDGDSLVARVHVLVRAEGTLQDALFESVRAPAQDGPDGEEETQEPEEDDHGPEVLAL